MEARIKMIISRAGIPRAAENLSEGQRICLRMVQLQMTSKEIARELGISSHTVDQRIRFAMRTLGAGSRTEAALILASVETPEMPGINVGGIDTQFGFSHLRSVDTQLNEFSSHLMHQSETLVEHREPPAQGFGGPMVGPSVDYRALDKNFLQEDVLRSSNTEFNARDNSGYLPGRSPGDEATIRMVNDIAGGIDWKWKTFFIFFIAIMALLSVGGLINAMIALSVFLK